MLFDVFLFYAAYTDYKNRIIPKIIVIGIYTLSVFVSNIPKTERIVGFLIPALPLFFIALRNKGIKGGDIKFLSAVGAYLGICNMAYILVPTTVTAVVWSVSKKSKSVPLAFVFAVGYVIFKAVIILRGG